MTKKDDKKKKKKKQEKDKSKTTKTGRKKNKRKTRERQQRRGLSFKVFRNIRGLGGLGWGESGGEEQGTKRANKKLPEAILRRVYHPNWTVYHHVTLSSPPEPILQLQL